MAAAEGNEVGKEDEDDVDEEAGDGEEEVMFLWGCMSCDDVMRVHVVIWCMCVSCTLHPKPLP
jgi:hypothetical protein